MKKTLLKTAVFLAVFLISSVTFSYFMNLGNENLTSEMAPAGLPVIMMETEGIAYNQLHGYREAMNPAYQRETVTELGAGREVQFVIDTYGEEPDRVWIEVRSIDGSRLIESTDVPLLTKEGERLHGQIGLKDLLEKDQEYMLVLLLDLQGDTVRYYTRILWSEDTKAAEKLQFVQHFHDLLYDRDAARAENLTRYLESNSSGDNTTFHKVNIHSSFQQVTWGDLKVTEETEPLLRITELGSQNTGVVLNYFVSTAKQDGEKTYYAVEETYLVRFLENAERPYLLSYDRTMTQIADAHGDIYENDKILLGIVDENLPLYESEKGDMVVFESAGKLWGYQTSSGRVIELFGFYDRENADARTLYDAHTIRVLRVEENGDVYFAVGGYMNRGRHEGEVGIAMYHYDAALNTVEEMVYLPTDKSADLLMKELDQLIYYCKGGSLYLYLDQTVYRLDTLGESYEPLVTITEHMQMMTSSSQRILAWEEGDATGRGRSLHITNLSSGVQKVIRAEEGTSLRLLGFMGEDMIYGVARSEAVTVDASGKIFFPMYRICIYDTEEALFEKETRDEIYMTDCKVEGNQIVLSRVERKSDGSYQSIDNDYIMMNEEAVPGQNQLVTVTIDTYKKYVQIKVKQKIEEKKLQVRKPKEVMFEGNREIVLSQGVEVPRYFVYDMRGITEITTNAARAVRLAYDCYGAVTDEQGTLLYRRGNLVARNQIMAIKAVASDGEKSSLAVCLDAMLGHAGVGLNAQLFLDQGLNAAQLLAQELPNAQILELKGVPFDALYYYLNRDIPVLAELENGEAVLLTGFNELQTVIMEPSTGKLYKKNKKEVAQWLEENGNNFLTYMTN